MGRCSEEELRVERIQKLQRRIVASEEELERLGPMEDAVDPATLDPGDLEDVTRGESEAESTPDETE